MRVRSIRRISINTEVYDLAVRKNSNFLLSNGIVVHNSKDLSDAVCNSLKAINDNLSLASEASVKYSSEAQLKVLNKFLGEDIKQILIERGKF